jgi:hypothetical protein
MFLTVAEKVSPKLRYVASLTGFIGLRLSRRRAESGADTPPVVRFTAPVRGPSDYRNVLVRPYRLYTAVGE